MDVEICALRTPQGLCTDPREELPDGTLSPRCQGHRGMPSDPTPAPGPFSGQQPSFAPAALARAQMVGAVVATLRLVHERGLMVFPEESQHEHNANRAAALIIDDLAADVLIKTVGGMAAGQVQA